jgi:hypothetical protein
MGSAERQRMRETVGLVLRARVDVFDKVTAEDFAVFEAEVESDAITYYLADLEAMEIGGPER